MFFVMQIVTETVYLINLLVQKNNIAKLINKFNETAMERQHFKS